MNASPTARQSGHIPNLLPRRGLSGSILVIIIGIMVFLAALALAGGLALGSAIGQWRDALAHDLTVQIPAGPDADAAVKRALEQRRGRRAAAAPPRRAPATPAMTRARPARLLL